jgi:beta-glucanase (GH16 family)
MKLLTLFFVTFLVIVSNNIFAQCFGNIVEGPLTGDFYHTACDNSNTDWKLFFEDNFDGSSLDESKWVIPYQGVLGGYNFDGWKNWYANTGITPSKPISDNLVVENGSLKIIARKENPPITGTVVTSWTSGGAPLTTMTTNYDYSSGWVESKKEFSYGWYEIKCTIPKGRGFWPAFWLFDQHNGTRSELDIFEFWNESACGTNGAFKPNMLSKNPHWTLHSNKYHPGGDDTQCAYDMYGCASNGGVDYSAIPHVFAVDWSPFVIVWYIDGTEVNRMYRYNTFNLINGQSTPIDCDNALIDNNYYANESWPTSDRMQVRFNLAMQYGNTNPKHQNLGFNNAPDATTPFPSTFDIEYFRYYKRNGPCPTSGTISSFPLDQEMYSHFVGQNIIATNEVINANYVVEMTASNTVTLNPGFEAADDSYFFAHIDPNYCVVYPGMAVNNEYQEKIPDKYQDQESTSLGVNTLSSDLDILKVYPNPSSDHVMIELTSSKGLNLIEITDNQGRHLLRDTRELNEVMNLDVSTFSPGTYFIKILNKGTGKVYLERFTKSK